jgi:putative intracellular protease/amidase
MNISDINTAYYLVFDGLADWEAALALAELQKSGRHNVVTVGIGSIAPEPVRTMGGVRLLPDITLTAATLDAISPEGVSVLILPGGEMWEQGECTEITALLQRFEAAGVAIAAICGATIAVAHAGLMNGRRHTSNGAEYIPSFVPSYTASHLYSNELAVRDDTRDDTRDDETQRGTLITASGVGSVEFAREILATLGIYDASTLAQWFALFKHGVMPDQPRCEMANERE